MRSRLLTLPLIALVALLVGGADGCSSDPNVEGAKLDLRNGDYAAALGNLDTALETDPSNAEALLLRVETRRQQYEDLPGNQKADYLAQYYGDMVADFRQAEQAAPDNSDLPNTRLALWALGVNAGNDVIRDADADVATAVDLFETTTELLPDSSQGYLGLGLAYLRDGNATEALPALERGTTAAPNDPVLAYYYGRALVLADRPSDAVSYLEEAQGRFPDDADIETMLLNAYTLAGETDQALERYAAAVEREPDNGAYRYNYGAILLQTENYDEAIVQLQRATELQPDNSDAFYNLGAAYQNRAAAFNEEANATEDVDAANGLIDQRDENLEMALEPLMQARTISAGSPDEAGVCDALFRVYTQLGRVDDATAVSECAGISMD